MFSLPSGTLRARLPALCIALALVLVVSLYLSDSLPQGDTSSTISESGHKVYDVSDVKRLKHYGRPDDFGPEPFAGSSNWITDMHKRWCYLVPNPVTKDLTTQGSQQLYLRELFRRFGTTNKFFVEFGFNEPSYTSGGSGANTRSLYDAGWRGLLLDGDRTNLDINLHAHYLYQDNICGIFEKYGVPKELDYLSVDMDSHDLFVFEAILKCGYRPRVITTEYNSNWPLNVTFTQTDPTLLPPEEPRPAGFTYADCVWGTSASALKLVGEKYGYSMIGRVAVLDIMWIRNDLLSDTDKKLLPSFGWFFKDAPLGQQHHPPVTTATLQFVRQLADYETFAATGDILAARRCARGRVSQMTDLPCLSRIRDATAAWVDDLEACRDVGV
jgi:hypothetical protein